MTFLLPAAFFLSVTIPVAVLLYLRRSRRVQQDVSSLLLWQRILARDPRHRFLGKLRRPLSLALALLILLLLLLALAKPDFHWSSGQPNTVIVMDLRARMQAGTTFASAVSEAKQLASAAGPGEEVAVLGVAGTPKLISSFSTDASDLRKRISGLSPTDGGGQVEDTLELARRLLEGREGKKRLVLLTDRPGTYPEVEVSSFGQSRENIALLGFSQRALPSSPQSAQILVKAGNFTKRARDVEFELLLDERPIDLQTMQVEAGGQADFTTTLPAATLRHSKGQLSARLTAKDDFPVDDEVRAIFPVQERLRVLLLTTGNPYLENALLADAGVALEILAPDQWRNELITGFDCVIRDDDFPTKSKFSAGSSNIFYFGASPFSKGEDFTPTDVRQKQSPLFWNVDFSGVEFFFAQPMNAEISPRPEVPLVSAQGPLVMTQEYPDGHRVVASAFGTGDSTFPLRVGFPLFISNVVHWLAQTDSQTSSEHHAGETFQPTGGWEISLPVGTDRRQSEAGPVTLDKNGFYELRRKDAQRWLAVNTSSAEEADLRSAQSTQGVTRSVLRLAGLLPWQWLALTALALLVAEWMTYHRRLTE